MANKKTTSERLAALSDGMFAVILTIMVLDLQRFHSCCIPKPQMLSGFFTKKKPPSATVKYGYMYCGTDLRPPAEATLDALIPLWPILLSYLVSYLFIAIIWVNHHHLLGFARAATAGLIWWNFAHLFLVSLVPATTAWMAATRLAQAPVFVYALVFVLVEIAYIAFEHTVFSQATERELPQHRRRAARIRSCIALLVFTLAAILSFRSPPSGLALVCCVLLIYLSPRLPELLAGAGRRHPHLEKEWTL